MLDLEACIRYAAASVPALLRQTAENTAYDKLWFLPALAEACRADGGPAGRAGEALREIFSKSRNALFGNRFLEPDRDILLSFASQLGASDRNGQMQLCTLTAQRLDRQLEEARKAYAEKGRLYSLLGIFAGIALVLFFL